MTRDLREFPETRWSQLLQIRDPGQPGYAERLEDLVRRYWTPAYHYLRAIRPGPPQRNQRRKLAMVCAAAASLSGSGRHSALTWPA